MDFESTSESFFIGAPRTAYPHGAIEHMSDWGCPALRKQGPSSLTWQWNDTIFSQIKLFFTCVCFFVIKIDYPICFHMSH